MLEKLIALEVVLKIDGVNRFQFTIPHSNACGKRSAFRIYNRQVQYRPVLMKMRFSGQFRL